MAEAARKVGHEYIAITDHSKSVTIANGLDERRMAAHVKKLQAANAKGLGIRILGAVVNGVRQNRSGYAYQYYYSNHYSNSRPTS